MSVDHTIGDAATSREGFTDQEFHAGRDLGRDAKTQAALPEDVVAFWQEAGRELWFAKDAHFDRRFRESFLQTHEAATRGELNGWLATPTGTLALILLLDQFPRNAFRGTPRMYASDTQARAVADIAIAVGHDRQVSPELRDSSTCRSVIPKSLPIRIAPSGCFGSLARPRSRMPSGTATSSAALGAFPTAIRFSAVR
jgi:Bacterial protein of unknown function (DUF924)